jgi:hypothetical protein
MPFLSVGLFSAESLRDFPRISLFLGKLVLKNMSASGGNHFSGVEPGQGIGNIELVLVMWLHRIFLE